MTGIAEVGPAIAQAVEQTFLNMTFIDVMVSDSRDIESGVSQLIVIDITRPARGAMLLRLPLALKRQIVENIHADQWEHLNAREIDDCLLEVLNVLAGNFLLSLFGESTKYNMTFPQIVFDEDEYGEQTDFEEFYFDAEGMVFEVSIRMEM